MRVAHLMLAHDRPDLAIRLAGVLDGPVFVHVDSKVDPAPFEPAGQLVTPRVHPSWGSFGIVEATVAGMRSALREPFDRLMLLSGRDYPIKPASVIHDEMEAQGSVIECAKFPHPDWADGGWPRVRRWIRRSGPSRKGLGMAALEARAQIETLVRGQREAPSWPYGGSAWWCLDREAVELIVTSCDSDPNSLAFWRRVWWPDEIFFQTLIVASGLPITNRTPTHMAWDSPGGIVELSDVAKLREVPQWFARKFNDHETLDLVDATLR